MSDNSVRQLALLAMRPHKPHTTVAGDSSFMTCFDQITAPVQESVAGDLHGDLLAAAERADAFSDGQVAQDAAEMRGLGWGCKDVSKSGTGCGMDGVGLQRLVQESVAKCGVGDRGTGGRGVRGRNRSRGMGGVIARAQRTQSGGRVGGWQVGGGGGGQGRGRAGWRARRAHEPARKVADGAETSSGPARQGRGRVAMPIAPPWASPLAPRSPGHPPAYPRYVG